MIRTLLQIAISILAITAANASPRVSLLTFFPGSEIYELEGHTALRVVDGRGDTAYNWGTFDFLAPGFVYRFVSGQTDYMVAAAPTDLFLSYYADSGRRVVEQELNLNEDQTARLIRLIDTNMRPENRVYRYNYVLDNCATRPLNLIERASGDSLTLEPYTGNGDTFREAMRHYHAAYPWYQFGIDMALGCGIDRQISNREKAFAPVDLMHIASTALVDDGSGNRVPLVRATHVMVNGRPGGASLPPTPWWLTPVFWAYVALGITIAVSWRNFIHHRLSRVMDTVLFGMAGIAGLVLTFLIFVSVHEATSPNWLYLWLNPMCLFIAAGVWIKKWSHAVYWLQIINFALVLTLGVLGAYGVQSLNAAFWPLMFSDIMRSMTYIYLYRCNAARPPL